MGRCIIVKEDVDPSDINKSDLTTDCYFIHRTGGKVDVVRGSAVHIFDDYYDRGITLTQIEMSGGNLNPKLTSPKIQYKLMPDSLKEEATAEQQPEKKKNFLTKLKEGVDDREEQLAVISTFVRLGILVWSGSILTLAYIKLPPALGIPEQKLDPTFIASVFTGVLATFGVQTAKKSGDGTMKMGGGAGVTKADMEKLIEKAAATAPAQVIRIEQAPIKFSTDNNGGEPPVKPTV